MVIDVHAHCIPQGFRSWLEENGAPVGAVPVDTPRGTAIRFADAVTTQPLRDDLADFDRRLAVMDDTGVDVQVLAGWIDLTGYELPERDAVTYSQAHNDFLAEEAARAPERFRPIGTAPLQVPEQAARELERTMTELGMVGAEIATTVRDLFLDQAGLDPFWEAAEGLGAFVLLHPMTPLGGVDLGRFFMSNAVGRPAESTIAAAGLILSGVLERFPKLKICIVHGGGYLPFQIGRLDRAYEVKPEIAGAEISRLPSDYLRRMWVDTVIHNPQVLRFLLDFLGADRVMLGTDYPFEMGDDDPVSFVRSVPGITDVEAEAVLGGNAERALG